MVLSKKHTLLIDGTNLTFKYSGLKLSSNGMPTGAIYGVLTFIASMIKKMSKAGEVVGKVVVVWDTAAPLIKTSETYKANRERSADSHYVYKQIEVLRELLTSLGAICVSKEGYEADDLAYTYVQRHEHERIMLVSSDHDYTAMIDGTRVQLYNWLTDKIEQPCGYDYVVYRSLMGDTSDNIKKIHGVDELRAMALAKKYNSVEPLLKHEHDLTEHAEAVRENARLLQPTIVGVTFPNRPTVHVKSVRKALRELAFQDKTIDRLVAIGDIA
jgi:DNA polymerase I